MRSVGLRDMSICTPLHSRAIGDGLIENV
jgi:hypothetical protein